MRVEINEITFLGPYFSRFVRDHCGDESESLIAKKMLPVSACIGASIRHKEMIRLDPDGILGVRPIILKRRIRYNFDMHVHVELCSYLDRAEEGRWEALVWLAELHAASFYGAVSISDAMGFGGSNAAGSPVRSTHHTASMDREIASPDREIERNGESIDPDIAPGNVAISSRDGASTFSEPVEKGGPEIIDPSESRARRGFESNNDASNSAKDKPPKTVQDSEPRIGEVDDADDEPGSEPFSFLSEMAQRDRD